MQNLKDLKFCKIHMAMCFLKERGFKITDDDNKISFDDLVLNNGPFIICLRNVQRS